MVRLSKPIPGRKKEKKRKKKMFNVYKEGQAPKEERKGAKNLPFNILEVIPAEQENPLMGIDPFTGINEVIKGREAFKVDEEEALLPEVMEVMNMMRNLGTNKSIMIALEGDKGELEGIQSMIQDVIRDWNKERNERISMFPRMDKGILRIKLTKEYNPQKRSFWKRKEVGVVVTERKKYMIMTLNEKGSGKVVKEFSEEILGSNHETKIKLIGQSKGIITKDMWISFTMEWR